MDTKALLKKVRKIEIKTRRLSDHIFGGEYHSTFKGKGMTFSEVRQYQFGDDVRNIDWNVTARYNRPHVKVFEEEREQVNILLIDVSKSMDFGSGKRSKKELMIELYATIAFSCALNKDKVGVLFFADKVERYFEPKSGMKNIWMIAMQLIEWKNESVDSDLQEPLRFLRALKLKRFRLFVLSDFHFERKPHSATTNLMFLITFLCITILLLSVVMFNA